MGHSGLPVRGVFGVAELLNPWFHAPSDTSPNDIYVGTVLLPGEEMRARAYVKVFPPPQRGQLVYNEVIGHYLAQQCELPSPFTFPCACLTSLLRPASQSLMAPEQNSRYVLGVASVDGGHKDLKQVGSMSPGKWADLMNWPHIARVAVFDELMGNDDRHLDNLVRRGPHDYLLIDNERILFGEPWFNSKIEELERKRCDSNILADTIAEATDEVIRKRMLFIAQQFVMAKQLVAPEVSECIEQLCGAPPGITAQLMGMLNARRNFLPTLMQWHMQKGDLFQARTYR